MNLDETVTFRYVIFFLFLFIFGTSNKALGRGPLILFGGGEIPADGVKRFVGLAGGADHARLLLISWATDEPEDSLRYFVEKFAPERPLSIEQAPPLAAFPKEEEHFLSQLTHATAVYFSGGDQLNIMRVFDRYPQFKVQLANLHDHGLLVGGTSAGTAIMSHDMFTGDGNEQTIDPGQIITRASLGFLPYSILVDTHFVVRHRLNRMLSVLSRPDFNFGIGIDEGAGILFSSNGEIENISDRLVVLIKALPSKEIKTDFPMRLLLAHQKTVLEVGKEEPPRS